MAEVTVNDGLRSGSRKPLYILVAPTGEASRFEFETVPGVAAVIPGVYEKNGKWSNTTYRVVLKEGARLVDATRPLHGTVCGNAATWAEAAEFIGVSVDALKGLFAPDGPNATRWDAADAALASLQ